MIPFRNFYFIAFIALIGPLQNLIFAVCFKDYGYDYKYRIFGHYKTNFAKKVINTE